MPTKTLAAVDMPTAPPTPSVFSSSSDMPRTSRGRTRQWKSKADNALITSTIGKAWKASTKLAPAAVSA